MKRYTIHMAIWILALAAITLIALYGLSRRAAAQDSAAGQVTFFEPVSGALNAATFAQNWTFDGHAGQVISLLAVTSGGNLDPVLQVLGPIGMIVAQNDDLDSLVHDAGLEAFALPMDGAYTARVLRYLGEEGTTTGTYQLTLTPGFARVERRDTFDQPEDAWLTLQGEPLTVTQGRLRLRATTPGETLLAVPPDAEPLQNFYFQADARQFGTPSYAEFGLVFRAQESDFGRAYHFKVNNNAQWSVELQDDSGVFALRSWTPDVALSGEEWTLGVLARDTTFSFFANGVLLGAVTDARLDGPGAIGLLTGSRADQTDPATVLFDNVAVTTRLGTTYRGLPLALAAWNSNDPGAIVNELAASGQVTPAPARDLFLPEKTLMATDPDARFELIGSDLALYDNFILGARVGIVTVGENEGCGLVYRWQDARNLDLAYVDTAGGFGVVQARDAQLVTNVYASSPMVNTDANKLVVIARGDHVALYVNGALVTQETVRAGGGRVGVALLNYQDGRTDCFWSNIWVWPLAE